MDAVSSAPRVLYSGRRWRDQVLDLQSVTKDRDLAALLRCATCNSPLDGELPPRKKTEPSVSCLALFALLPESHLTLDPLPDSGVHNDG